MNPGLNDLSSSRALTALLCIHSQEVLETTTTQLTTLGFKAHSVSTPEQALDHLYSHACDVLVVSDDFGGGDAHAHPVLVQLASVPLNLRRKLFVILLGPNLTPNSQMQAFALSVDLVLRPQDVVNLNAILAHSLAAQELFYATFNEVQQQLRKEG